MPEIDFPMLRGGPNGIRYAPGPVPRRLEIASDAFDIGVRDFLGEPCASVPGRIIVQSDSELQAFGSTGEEVWRFTPPRGRERIGYNHVAGKELLLACYSDGIYWIRMDDGRVEHQMGRTDLCQALGWPRMRAKHILPYVRGLWNGHAVVFVVDDVLLIDIGSKRIASIMSSLQSLGTQWPVCNGVLLTRDDDGVCETVRLDGKGRMTLGTVAQQQDVKHFAALQEVAIIAQGAILTALSLADGTVSWTRTMGEGAEIDALLCDERCLFIHYHTAREVAFVEQLDLGTGEAKWQLAGMLEGLLLWEDGLTAIRSVYEVPGTPLPSWATRWPDQAMLSTFDRESGRLIEEHQVGRPAAQEPVYSHVPFAGGILISKKPKGLLLTSREGA